MKHTGQGIVLSILACFWLFCSCGSKVDFSSGSIKKVFSPESSSTNSTPNKGDEDASSVSLEVAGEIVNVGSNAFWFWQCKNQIVPYPSDKPDTTTKLEGDGEYIFSFDNEVTLDISGRFCEPAKASRDIIFVVDVSDSMRGLFNSGNDPVKNNTCGRNEAIKAMIEDLEDTARIALITFDRDLSTTSGFLPVDEFAAAYTNVDVLCEKGASTNYSKPLTQTLTYLEASRPEAFKEVYFISDGDPQDSWSNFEDEIAAVQSKATLATLMLKGDDQVLIDMASNDAFGNPLYAHASNADDLAAALGSIANAELTDGTFFYGEKDSGVYEEVNLYPSDSLNFELDSIVLSKELYPAGLDVYYEYFDNRGLKYGRKGSIVWGE